MTRLHIDEPGSSLIIAASGGRVSTPKLNADECLPVRGSAIRRAIARQARGFYGNYMLMLAPREAIRLIRARPASSLGRLVFGPGRIQALAAQPFVCAGWASGMRLRRMIEHCAIVDQLGHPFNLSADQYVELIAFELDGEHCRMMLDQPKWLDCDGMLCASLWVGGDRIFSISFCLSGHGPERTAYIGGIQGRRSEQALDQNRALTKAAHGMRPRDLSFELFRMLMAHLEVTRLAGVADASRYQMTKRAMLKLAANDKVLTDYNDIWESRGGVLGNDGFFLMPVTAIRRSSDEIAAKKRGMYKKRYALLDQLQSDVNFALQGNFAVRSHAVNGDGYVTPANPLPTETGVQPTLTTYPVSDILNNDPQVVIVAAITLAAA